MQTSGAKAPRHTFNALTARVQLVPFPNLVDRSFSAPTRSRALAEPINEMASTHYLKFTSS
jgi:hypothetical protein